MNGPSSGAGETGAFTPALPVVLIRQEGPGFLRIDNKEGFDTVTETTPIWAKATTDVLLEVLEGLRRLLAEIEGDR